MGKAMTREVMKIKIRGVLPNDTYQRKRKRVNQKKNTVGMMMLSMVVLMMGIVSDEILIRYVVSQIHMNIWSSHTNAHPYTYS